MKKSAALAIILLTIACFASHSQAGEQEGKATGEKPNGLFVLPIVKRDSLLNGLQVITLEQPGTGTVTARLRINKGATFDLAGKSGLADVTAEMLLKGGGGFTARNVAETIEQFGIRAEVKVGWDSTNIVISGAADSLDSIFELLTRLIISPAFDQKELDALKTARVAALKGEATTDAQAARQKALATVFGSHPFAGQPRGTPESIAAINRQDVTYFHNRFYLANNASLIISGDTTAEQVTRLARTKLGAWKKGEQVPPSFRPPELMTARKVIVLDRPNSQLSYATIAQPGISRRASDYMAVAVMVELLKIRTSKQAAASSGSSVEADYDARFIPGPIFIDIKSPPTEISALLESTLAAMASLKSAEPSSELVEAAKARVVASFTERLRTTEGTAEIILDIDMYGLGRDYLINFGDRLNAVTPSDVHRSAQAYLQPQSVAVVVAGPAGKLESELKKLGQVTVVR